MIAITFTEKAAREMRTRVRKELRKLVLGSQNPDRAPQVGRDGSAMDSARIGTIHSLCAEILRAHPAEAGLDPQFGVLDENETIQLRAAAVEAALLAAVQPDPIRPDGGQSDAGEPADLRALFDAFSIGRLEGTARAAAGQTPGGVRSTRWTRPNAPGWCWIRSGAFLQG